MGPLSIAQFLPLGVLEFDLLVMDEAGQLQPIDARGAVARAKQVVVVGDERQLPPTKFLSKMTSGATEDEDDQEGAKVSDATGDSAPGSIVELRAYEDRSGRHRVALAVRSDLSIESQIHADDATWLDRQLIGNGAAELADGGFGGEVKAAMEVRAKRLVEDGLASHGEDGVAFRRNLRATLRRKELERVAANISADTGLPWKRVEAGEHVSGIYRQRVTLASGRFAMIDDGMGFQLVPWMPSVEQHLGRQVSGVARSGGA